MPPEKGIMLEQCVARDDQVARATRSSSSMSTCVQSENQMPMSRRSATSQSPIGYRSLQKRSRRAGNPEGSDRRPDLAPHDRHSVRTRRIECQTLEKRLDGMASECRDNDVECHWSEVIAGAAWQVGSSSPASPVDFATNPEAG